MSRNKVVLAYSGGLDTSVAIRWLQERAFDVVALTVDVGQPGDLAGIKEKAEKLGAKAVVVDVRHEFADEFILPALKANAMYEGQYPLSTAVARPLIGKHLVAVARREGAKFVAHGCTGKGNDQVRFDLCTTALAPELTVIAPARVWQMTREQEIEYAREHGIPVPVENGSPYSTDENLWGRSIECGVLEDPRIEPPEEVLEYSRTVASRYATLIYDGLWFTPLREAFDAFVESTQTRVSGDVSVKLFKGSATVVGRASPNSLYDHGLATYSKGDAFRQDMAEGFIYVWGLPARTWAAVGEKAAPAKLVKTSKRAKREWRSSWSRKGAHAPPRPPMRRRPP